VVVVDGDRSPVRGDVQRDLSADALSGARHQCCASGHVEDVHNFLLSAREMGDSFVSEGADAFTPVRRMLM
jgi:hypothetical protein